VQVQDQQFLVANMTNHCKMGLMEVGLGALFFNKITCTNYTLQSRAPNIVDQMAAQSSSSSRTVCLALGNENRR
jgi:hypothetical protein